MRKKYTISTNLNLTYSVDKNGIIDTDEIETQTDASSIAEEMVGWFYKKSLDDLITGKQELPYGYSLYEMDLDSPNPQHTLIQRNWDEFSEEVA